MWVGAVRCTGVPSTRVAHAGCRPRATHRGGTMRLLLLFCAEGPIAAEPGERDAAPWVEEMDRRGVRLIGDRLRPPSDATTVRVRDHEVLVSDGPYVETKEIMGGF